MARPQAPVGAAKPDTQGAQHRARLEALRDALTERLAVAGNRDMAPIAAQLRAVLLDLAAIPDATEASDVDDLARKRARRRAAASAS